jgi:predicted ATPase
VLEILSRARSMPRALEASMVGRQAELTRLRSAFRRVVRSGAPVRFTLLGEAGIGKSRLAKEMVASIGTQAYAVTVECPAYGTGLFPMRQAIVEAAGVTGWRTLHDLLAADNDGERVPPEIAAAIGLRAEPSNADALFSGMQRLFARLSAERPVIVALEDLHWAEPTFLDLIDRLARDSTGPIFLLCIARPELIERRAEWGTDDVLQLDALPLDDLERLIRDRATTIAPHSLQRIINISQGNPFFAEQLLAALDDGTDDAVPPSLVGLLTMRLDRLGPAERDLLRCASIVGMDVESDAVAELLPDEARPFLKQHLETLERRRLIEWSGTRAFRFRHVLIQLAAYQSMTREDRARLHELFADWLGRTPDREPELQESRAYHLAQAADHRRRTGVTVEGSRT